MNTFYMLVAIAAGSYLVHKVLERISALERRVAFLEDRSPQAQYIRHLENKEKGWEVESVEMRAVIKHFLNLNSAQNLVLRALILNDEKVWEQLKFFCEKYEAESDEEKIFIGEIGELVVPVDE